jgi:hypothetical protein
MGHIRFVALCTSEFEPGAKNKTSVDWLINGKAAGKEIIKTDG